MKDVLLVVDERCMGGVSTLLKDMLNMIDLSKLNIDILVLHDRGDMLEDLPKSVNLIFGTKYFEAVDIPMKEVVRSKNIKTLFQKLRVVFDMKTGLIEGRIRKERRKILKKKYDYEIAFKDGFTALFTAFGDSKVKYHWIQYNYKEGNPNAKYAKLFNRVLPMFDKIISVSDGVKEDFVKLYGLEDKIEVIYNLVNTDRIKGMSLEKCDLVLDKDKFNIACVGRLDNRSKAYDRLIDVIAKLDKEGLFDDVVLRFFGDGPDKDELEEKIKEYNLTDRVILYGRVNNPYKYMKNQDLFVLSSKYESFGLVVVEALTVGVPVLATETSAIRKILDDGVNGRIVQNSEDGLYNGLKEILENKKVIKEYKNNLKGYHYDNDKLIKKIEELF